MPPLTAILFVLALAFGLAVLPQMWVRKVIARHSADRPDFPRHGGEFARHLLDEMKLGHVKVEETSLGDHYDPEAKGAAPVAAAHEGALAGGARHRRARDRPRHAGRDRLSAAAGTHAAGQAGDADGEGRRHRHGWRRRSVMALARAPYILVIEVFVGVLILALSMLMHAVTLPVEFDASFGRALPVLKAWQVHPGADDPGRARSCAPRPSPTWPRPP